MTTDMQAELDRIASELRAYNPAADECKGEHIHKVWAREIEAALASRPDAQADERGAPTLWEAFEMGFGLRSAMLGHVLDGRDVGRLTTCEFWHPALHDMHIGTDLHVGLTVGEAIVRLKNEVRRRLDALVAAAPQAIVKGDERMTQWQFRTKTTTSEPAGTWRNGSEEGIKRLIAKHPNFYEVRALVDRAAAPQAEAAQGVPEGWADQARKALEPFASIGQWLFARPLPDDTPVVDVRGLNGKASSLTRGMFKAAHMAFAAAPSLDREQVGEAGNPCLVQEKCAWPACRRECVIRQDVSPSRECGERQSFPERDPSKTNAEQGLHRKFEVRRVDGSDSPGGKHDGCEYFVLDMTHDQHAPAALRAYAQACASTHPHLSADLIARFGGERKGAALSEDARECLQDVVSHYDNIVAGFAAQRLNACEAGDSDNATYWTREMNVAHRMKAQAERALAGSAPTLTNGMDRSQFHDKAWALWQAKALDSSLLPKLSIHAIRTLWDVLYDSMPSANAVVQPWLTDEHREAIRAAADTAHRVLCAGGDYGDELSDAGLRRELKAAADALRALLANGE